MTIPAWVKGTVLLVVTLTAGVVIGAGYERGRTSAHDAARMDAHHIMRRFKDDLRLDSAQQKAIAAILARHQGTVDSTWHTMQPHVGAMLDSTLQEIADVLRPDQMAKYRKMVEAVHHREMPR